MNCKNIIVIGVCLLFLVGVTMVSTGACQQTKGNETTTTTPPQGNAPSTQTPAPGEKEKEKGKDQKDTTSKPAEKKRTYEGC
jgi:cytoskeletal protein RodZ